jgi:hypothetical protein
MVSLMNRFLSLLFILLLAFPMVLPWMSHEYTHALHNQSVSHKETNLYSGVVHTHTAEHLQNRFIEDVSVNTHHYIDVSLNTYFDEYLLVELANSKQVVSATSAKPTQDTYFHWTHHVLSQQGDKQPSLRDQGQPFQPSHTSVYLYTQRFRV